MIRPTRGHVLVRTIPRDTEVAGGLLVRPENARDPWPIEGEVLAVGPGKRTTKGVELEPAVKAAGVRSHMFTLISQPWLRAAKALVDRGERPGGRALQRDDRHQDGARSRADGEQDPRGAQLQPPPPSNSAP